MKSPPELMILDNGMRVLCDFMPGRESVAIGVWVKTGSRFENTRNQGISHFLEHMLFQGSRKRSSRQISQIIEGRGGTLNGFTTEEYTCYWARVRGSLLGQALEVLLDLVFNPRLHPRAIEKEKGVIKEEIRMYRDNPASYVEQLLQETMWPGQALGRSILGTEKTVGHIQRDDLIHYRCFSYLPTRMAVIACGNLQGEKIIKELRQQVPSLEVKKSIPFRPAIYNQLKNPICLQERPTEQVNMCLGMEGLSCTHPRKYALALLNVILGANMSSRLFQEVRERRGWVYSIRSELDHYRDRGTLVISAGLPPRRLERALVLIMKQLRSLSRRPPSTRELNRAKEYYLGQTALSAEQTVARMLWLGANLISADKVITLSEVSREISRIQPEDIRWIAEKIFRPGRICLALIGPLGKSGNRARISNLLEM